MVKSGALDFVNGYVVQPSCSWLFAGVTMRSGFWKNDGLPSVISVDLSSSLATIVGTITCWNGPATTFYVVLSAKTPHLKLPCSGRSCIDISGKWIMLFFKSNVTEYFLKDDIPMNTLPLVGSTVNCSSKNCTATKTQRMACVQTSTIMPLATCFLPSMAAK